MIQVFIIDDHPMVVEGIKALLSGSALAEVSGFAHDGAAALEKLQSQTADLAFVDINLPGMDGIELCARLRKDFPKLKILGLSTFKERSYIMRMIESGASGYLLKNASREELEEAISIVMRGRMFLNAEIAEVLARPSNTAAAPLLTAREKEVLGFIADGHTNLEIAEKLFISPLTVDSHRKNLLAKFGVKNTAAMIRAAIEQGLISQ